MHRIAIIGFFLASAGVASAQPKSPSSSPVCAQLSRQFVSLEKDMAAADIDGLLDNSAPRAQLRAQENGNRLSQAKIVVDLMIAKACTLPNHAPLSANYFAAALACKNDTVKGIKDAPSCDKGKWEASLDN